MNGNETHSQTHTHNSSTVNGMPTVVWCSLTNFQLLRMKSTRFITVELMLRVRLIILFGAHMQCAFNMDAPKIMFQIDTHKKSVFSDVSAATMPSLVQLDCCLRLYIHFSTVELLRSAARVTTGVDQTESNSLHMYSLCSPQYDFERSPLYEMTGRWREYLVSRHFKRKRDTTLLRVEIENDCRCKVWNTLVISKHPCRWTSFAVNIKNAMHIFTGSFCELRLFRYRAFVLFQCAAWCSANDGGRERANQPSVLKH